MAAENTNDKWNKALWCGVYGAGLISTLVVYGLLQEKIMTIPFGAGSDGLGGELFKVSAFLVFCNRMCNIAYAGSMIKVQGESFQNQAPIGKYLVIALSNVAATTCQYECLKYVSFPVQMLGKSFKMIPVMLWGMAISGKKFSVVDWTVALCVTFGVTEFCMTGPMSSPNDAHSSIKGLILLVLFLGCDGLTSTMQEKLFKQHATSKFNQMFYVNGCSAFVSLVTLIAMGTLDDCFAFCVRHTDFVGCVAILSLAAASSQYFIYSQVKEFGALVFAATMNVRQIISILVSYVHYHHELTWLQSIGLLAVFSALFCKSYLGLVAPKDEEKAALLPKGIGSDAEAKPQV